MLVKDSVCLSPCFVSGSLSMVFSGCEVGFPSGNSKIPAKSCSVHHLGLVCSYARQNIPSFLLPGSSQCYTGVWFFWVLFCFDFSISFCFVGLLFGFVFVFFLNINLYCPDVFSKARDH